MPCVTELNHLPCLLVPYGDAILDLAQRLFIGLPPPLKVLAATHESLALDRARTTWCSVLRSSPKGVITFARITLFSSFLHFRMDSDVYLDVRFFIIFLRLWTNKI